jgi:hypothetical protein
MPSKRKQQQNKKNKSTADARLPTSTPVSNSVVKENISINRTRETRRVNGVTTSPTVNGTLGVSPTNTISIPQETYSPKTPRSTASTVASSLSHDDLYDDDTSVRGSFDSPPLKAFTANTRSASNSPSKKLIHEPLRTPPSAARTLEFGRSLSAELLTDVTSTAAMTRALSAQQTIASKTTAARILASSASVVPLLEEKEANTPPASLVYQVSDTPRQRQKPFIIPSAYPTDWMIEKREAKEDRLQIILSKMAKSNTAEILPVLPPVEKIRKMYADNLAFRRGVEHTVRELIATIAWIRHKADLKPDANGHINEEEHTDIIHYGHDLQDAFRNSKEQVISSGYLRKRVLVVNDPAIAQFGTSDKFGPNRAPKFIDGLKKPIDYSKAMLYLPQSVGYDANSTQELKRIINFYIKLGVPAANIHVYVAEYNNIQVSEQQTLIDGDEHYAEWSQNNLAWLDELGVITLFHAEFSRTEQYKRATQLVTNQMLLDNSLKNVQLRDHMRNDAKTHFKRLTGIKVKADRITTVVPKRTPSAEPWPTSPTLPVNATASQPLSPESASSTNNNTVITVQPPIPRSTSPVRTSPTPPVTIQNGSISPLSLGSEGDAPTDFRLGVVRMTISSVATGMYTAHKNKAAAKALSSEEQRQSNDEFKELLAGTAIEICKQFGFFGQSNNQNQSVALTTTGNTSNKSTEYRNYNDYLSYK